MRILQIFVLLYMIQANTALPFCDKRPDRLAISKDTSTPLREAQESEMSWNNRLTFWFLNDVLRIEPEGHNNWLIGITASIGTPTVYSWIKYAKNTNQIKCDAHTANAAAQRAQAMSADATTRASLIEAAEKNEKLAENYACSHARASLAMGARIAGTLLTVGATGQWIYRAVNEGTGEFWKWKDEEQLRHAQLRAQAFQVREAKKNFDELVLFLGPHLDKMADEFTGHRNSFEKQLCSSMGDENSAAAKRKVPFDKHNEDVDQAFLRLEEKKWLKEKIALALMKHIPDAKEFRDEKGRPLPVVQSLKKIIRVKETDPVRREYFGKVAIEVLYGSFNTFVRSTSEVYRFFDDALVRAVGEDFSEAADQLPTK